MARRTLVVLVALLLATTSVNAGTLSSSQIVLSWKASTGDYQIRSRAPAWTLAGTTASPWTNASFRTGHDRIGDWQQVRFEWRAGGALAGKIRVYNKKPVVLFSLQALEARDRLDVTFPDFTTVPKNLHPFSFADEAFAPHRFSLNQTSTPWLLFDDKAEALILSPASDFIVSRMTGDGASSMGSGLNPELRGVPARFTHRTLLVWGNGIGSTFQRWGNALTSLMGRHRPRNDADTLLKYLGYWTDAGGAYWYNYEPDRGYTGTLLTLGRRYRRERIPIRYLQLDSWWYQKTRTMAGGEKTGPKNPELPEGTWNAYGGTLLYAASPLLFPHGLARFHHDIGLPFAVHNRWTDPTSPYHARYRFSGVAAVDLRWWENIAAYLKASGVICYEQDWMNEIYRYSPAMAARLEVGKAFTDGMAHGCRDHGIDMQYCMATPRFFLQGASYDNLTTIRVSGDRFERNHWENFLYTSALASALGIWPWADVFNSTERDNLLLATLSAGPVGIGDFIGKESAKSISRAVRSDGVIVKPDVPLTVTDGSFISDARQTHQPLLAWTYTDQGIRTAYIFGFSRRGDAREVSFEPASFGFTGDVYVYDGFKRTARRTRATDQCTRSLDEDGAIFLVIAPVGRSGIALLGDADKFVGTGRQRITAIESRPGRLSIGVAFARGEKDIALHGFADMPPQAYSIGGHHSRLHYDAATRHFTFAVSPDAGQSRMTVFITPRPRKTRAGAQSMAVCFPSTAAAPHTTRPTDSTRLLTSRTTSSATCRPTNSPRRRRGSYATPRARSSPTTTART